MYYIRVSCCTFVSHTHQPIFKCIQVIGNTAMPVIRLKTLQMISKKSSHPNNMGATTSVEMDTIISLDISFEGPGHMGLEVNYITLLFHQFLLLIWHKSW